MEPEIKKPKNKSIGFTSYANNHLTCSCLSDELFRFKIVLESHMGIKGTALVKLETIAKEMGKHPRSVSRYLHWFLDNSNLKAVKTGYIYQYSTSPDTSVLYGMSRVSHISLHTCPHIKISKDKEVYKKTLGSFKRELSKEENDLVEEITEWVSRPIFKPLFNDKQNKYRVLGALTKHGYDVLKKLYTEIAVNGYDPHPKVFWERLGK